MASSMLFSVGVGPASALAATADAQNSQPSTRAVAFNQLIPDAALRQAIMQYGETLTIETDQNGETDEIRRRLSNDQINILQNSQSSAEAIKSVLNKVDALLLAWPIEDVEPNKIANLTGLSNLPNLKYLDLDSQNITTINNNTFAGLPNLTSLGLGNNKITAIPANTFSNLPKLEALNLEFNRISSLNAGSFSGLSKLERLSLVANQLTTLPSNGFSSLSKLTSLELDDNQLTTLSAGMFSGLGNLETLALEDNQLTTMGAGTFTGLNRLLDLSLFGNSGLTDYAALADLPLKSQYVEATLDSNLIKSWYQAVRQAGNWLGIQPSIPVPVNYSGKLNDVINVAKYERIVQGKGGDSKTIVNLSNATTLTSNAGVQASVAQLQAAINAGNVMQLADLVAAVYAAADRAIVAKVNQITNNLGNYGTRDAAVVSAKADVNEIKQTRLYDNLDYEIGQLQTAVNNFRTNAVNKAKNTINQAKSKKIDQAGAIRPVLAKLQASINAKQYDAMIDGTSQLQLLIKQTKRVNTTLTIDKAYHQNKYLTGKTSKGTKVVVRDAKTKRQLGTAKANAKGIFKVKLKNVKGGQRVTITADRTDEAKIIYQAVSKQVTIKKSPKPKATKFKINKQRVTGVATKGTTIRVYKGSKLIKKVRVKNAKVKFNLKKKYQKKTKLKIKVQHTHAKGFGVRQFSIRVR